MVEAGGVVEAVLAGSDHADTNLCNWIGDVGRSWMIVRWYEGASGWSPAACRVQGMKCSVARAA